MKNDVNGTSVPHPDLDPKDSYVFGPPGSTSGSVSHRLGSEDPDTASGSVPKCHGSAALLSAMPLRKVPLHRAMYSVEIIQPQFSYII